MSDYVMKRTLSGNVYPFPNEVAHDDRLDATEKRVWAAMATFTDERGRPWTTAAERQRRRPDGRISYEVVAARCGWPDEDGVEVVRRAVHRLRELGHVRHLGGGRYELTWVARNAAELVADGVWTSSGCRWFNAAAAIGPDWCER